METLLDLARNAKLPVDSALVDIILQSADHMNQCLLGVESGVAPALDVAPLIARMEARPLGSDSPCARAVRTVAAEPNRAPAAAPSRKRPPDPAR